MQLSLILSTLAAAATCASAMPVLETRRENVWVNNTREFYIKSISDRAEFSNLYLSSFHTGAGSGDATFLPYDQLNVPVGGAYINGTNLQFDYDTDFPWGVSTTWAPYSAWSSLTIDAGFGDGNYALSGKNLVSTIETSQGWLICNWAHQTPQLFIRFPWKKTPSNPACAPATLEIEWI